MATNSLQWQITANRGMSLATREQKAVMTNFVLCRAFLVLFARQKARIERLEQNKSEQLRLETAVKCNGERKRYRHCFLRPFLNILLS